MTNPTPTRAEVEALVDKLERKSLSEYAAMAVPMLRAYAALRKANEALGEKA